MIFRLWKQRSSRVTGLKFHYPVLIVFHRKTHKSVHHYFSESGYYFDHFGCLKAACDTRHGSENAQWPSFMLHEFLREEVPVAPASVKIENSDLAFHLKYSSIHHGNI